VKEESYSPSEYIIREGTIGTKFYFVMSGIVKIFSDKGSYKFERFYSAGSYFGETALLKADQKRGAE
jgi:CRP-like cAMP-binding protein